MVRRAIRPGHATGWCWRIRTSCLRPRSVGTSRALILGESRPHREFASTIMTSVKIATGIAGHPQVHTPLDALLLHLMYLAHLQPRAPSNAGQPVQLGQRMPPRVRAGGPPGSPWPCHTAVSRPGHALRCAAGAAPSPWSVAAALTGPSARVARRSMSRVELAAPARRPTLLHWTAPAGYTRLPTCQPLAAPHSAGTPELSAPPRCARG